MSVVKTLQAIPLFSQLREGDVSRLGQAVRERRYGKNSVITLGDQPGDALYIVLSGQVKIVLIGEDGREVILSMRSKGDFFGEMALMDDEPDGAHVIAMEDSTLLVLRREDFHQCLEDMPRIAFGLFRALCRRVRQADNKIGGLVLLDVPGRVSRLLLEMADENDGVHITKRITHYMIAQMVGSSRETVSRTMRTLTANNVIDANRKLITIKDRRALETASGRSESAARARKMGQNRRANDPSAAGSQS